ncbi:immunity-related GTPase family Q protein [Dromiciops gliroides]|uniref:immunity-related GTPase family Q protein n=1 Tax=Dromiciops gliroides TaxID=33562 RepID=UPI001CC47619|nr:immunity-related GTPase family Q protein [Dromiciops gliroides]XP_043849072.1 immunity-related GTPase family Q protein [Dromiciops gliroides]XP_043849073.1 immunity-related GTPase family Q protein [Dromiciops gliroides]XP_043849074.1 immunity-related GTPase family Q protein [Dromiciops gliroides]XP_043849075.1 immunity-related GTPase family Q protein [Dromiciops gliroides]
MPPPRGDVTALFLGPPGSGKSELIAALREAPEAWHEDSQVPALYPARPGLFLGELSCPPAAPEAWAAEADVLVLVWGPQDRDGVEEGCLPQGLGAAGRAALARGAPLLAVWSRGPKNGSTGSPGQPEDLEQERKKAADQLAAAGLGAAPLYVLSRPGPQGAELTRLREALHDQGAALERLLPPAQEGFEVVGGAELEAVREAFEAGGLEAAMTWLRSGLERLGSARVDLGVAGPEAPTVIGSLLGQDPEPTPSSPGPAPYPAPERPNVVLWALLEDADPAPSADPGPAHYDALVLVVPGPPTPADVARGRALVGPVTPLFFVRTDGEGEDPEPEEDEEKSGSGDGMDKEKGSEDRKECGGEKNSGSGSTARDGAQKSGGASGEHEMKSDGGDGEEEGWEVLGAEEAEDAPPPVFPLRPGGLPGLAAALRRALAPAQGTALLLALPPASAPAARAKADALRAGAWRAALLASVAAAASPAPGLGHACDVALLRGQLAGYRRALGLEAAAVARRELALGLEPGTLVKREHSRLALNGAARGEVEARLRGWAGEGTAGGAALGALSFLWPAGGAAATGGLGYRAAHGVLLAALEELQADAEAVLGPGPDAE